MMKETKDERWKALTVAFVLVFAAVAALISVPYTASATYGTPEITDNSDTMAYTGDSFTFNASVSNSSDGNVWANYSVDGGATNNLELTPTGWQSAYTNTMTLPMDATTMEYHIAAKNTTSGNWTETTPTTLEVEDNDAPYITDMSPTRGTTHDTFTFKAQVEDNIDVSADIDVSVFWWGAGMEMANYTETPMNHTEDMNYTASITVPKDVSELHYQINATDTSDNKEIRAGGSVPCFVDVEITVEDKQTGEPVEEAKVSLTDGLTTGIGPVMTNEDGEAVFYNRQLKNLETMFLIQITEYSYGTTIIENENTTAEVTEPGMVTQTAMVSTQDTFPMTFGPIQNEDGIATTGADVTLTNEAGDVVDTKNPVKDGTVTFEVNNDPRESTWHLKVTHNLYQGFEKSFVGRELVREQITLEDRINTVHIGPVKEPDTRAHRVEATGVTLYDGDMSLGTEYTNSQGNVTFNLHDYENVTDIQFTAVIANDDYATVEHTFTGNQTGEIMLNPQSSFDLQVGPVMDANMGNTISNSTVTLEHGADSWDATTDSNGMAGFTLDFNPYGEQFTTSADHSNYESKTIDFVSGQEDSEIHLSKDQWEVTVGAYKDKNGKFIQDAMVTIEADGTPLDTKVTNDAGKATFTVSQNPDTTDYTVSLMHDDLDESMNVDPSGEDISSIDADTSVEDEGGLSTMMLAGAGVLILIIIIIAIAMIMKGGKEETAEYEYEEEEEGFGEEGFGEEEAGEEELFEEEEGFGEEEAGEEEELFEEEEE